MESEVEEEDLKNVRCLLKMVLSTKGVQTQWDQGKCLKVLQRASIMPHRRTMEYSSKYI